MGDTRDIAKAHERIIANADRSPDGCLESRYSTVTSGYAQVWDGESTILAHRIVWEHHHGPIDDGMIVVQTCNNRKCVEIRHLVLVPRRVAYQRTADGEVRLDGRCKHGHEAKHWRPKNKWRQKGYCQACRMVRRGIPFREETA